MIYPDTTPQQMDSDNVLLGKILQELGAGGGGTPGPQGPAGPAGPGGPSETQSLTILKADDSPGVTFNYVGQTFTVTDEESSEVVFSYTNVTGVTTFPGPVGFTQGATGNLTGNLTGNASTATTLATARTINGVSFNGSADIVVPALSTHSTLTYAATTNIDFANTVDDFRTVTLTGNITFTTSNLAAGRSRTIRIIGDASLRTFTFPAWKFVGAAAPASLAASKIGILTLTAFGAANADVVAAYAAEP